MIALNRNRAYYRKQRARAISRKKVFLKRLGGDELIRAWSRGEFGRLSKGKIHCSCWMCRIKSYGSKSHSDKKKETVAVQQMLNCLLSLIFNFNYYLCIVSKFIDLLLLAL